MYILNSVGDKTEPCGSMARIILGVDISSFIETAFPLRKKRANELDKTGEKCNFDNLYSKPVYLSYLYICYIIGLYDIKEYRSRRHVFAESKGHVIR
jgi:hypothetical protein